MDARCISKQKTKAERPYSNEGNCQRQKDNVVLSGLCNVTNQKKKDKYNAHLKKPDPNQEILILICIIKKGIKMLCRYGNSRRQRDCKVPDYDRIYFFVDTSKRFDKFKEEFVKIYNGRNSLCCYSKLLKELKTIKHCFSKEINNNYCLYKCKMDLINCLMASFRSIENKICMIMACSNGNSCDQACDTLRSPSKLSKLSSKLSCGSSKCSFKRESGSNSSKRCQVKDPCDCLDVAEPEKDNSDNTDKEFDMTLEYCKYRMNDDDTGSSSGEDVETFKQDLPNGFIESKIYKKNETISLSIKCVTNGDGSGIICLRNEAKDSDRPNQIVKIANDMARLLDMSKQWYSSGKQVCQQILKQC